MVSVSLKAVFATGAFGPRVGSGAVTRWGVGSPAWLAGSRPRRAPAPNGLGRAASYRSPDDFQSMRRLRKSSNDVLSLQCSAFWLKSAGALRSHRARFVGPTRASTGAVSMPETHKAIGKYSRPLYAFGRCRRTPLLFYIDKNTQLFENGSYGN